MTNRPKSALLLAGILMFAAGTTLAASDPTIQDVYNTAESGNLSKAQAMMDTVLKDHPNSAKAHFVEAELSVKQNDLVRAKIELDRAKALEPSLAFAKAGAVASLEARISSSGSPQSHSSNGSLTNGHLPWGIIAAGLVFVFGLVAFMRSRNNSTTPTYPNTFGGGVNPAGPYPQNGFGYNNSPMGPQGGAGSGLLGSLATGAAMGAGVVAGEALMHKMLDSHTSNNIVPTDLNAPNVSVDNSNYDMGGADFGLQDDSNWDDSSTGESSNDDSWN